MSTRIIVALLVAAIAVPLGANVLDRDNVAVAQSFEDGSVILSDGTTACRTDAPCDDSAVVWHGILQDTVAQCGYFDGWGEPACELADLSVGNETLQQTADRIGK